MLHSLSLRTATIALALTFTLQLANASSIQTVQHGNGQLPRLVQLAGNTIFGRWCDVMVPGNDKFRREITIIAASHGLVARTRLFDGSRQTLHLRERSSGILEVVGSGAGDKYRVSGGTGDLQLLDNDGLIRTATRLENTPQSGDCIR